MHSGNGAGADFFSVDVSGLQREDFSRRLILEGYRETKATQAFIARLAEDLHPDDPTLGRGFLALIGDKESGASMLLAALLVRLRQRSTRIALISDALLDKKELLERIRMAFGLRHRPGLSPSQTLIILHTFLLHQYRQERRCVIAVDDAHHLSQDALEALLQLAGLQTNGIRLARILVCGRPELARRLRDHRLERLMRSHGRSWEDIAPPLPPVSVSKGVTDDQGTSCPAPESTRKASPPQPGELLAKPRKWLQHCGLKGMAGFVGIGLMLAFVTAALLGWFIGQNGPHLLSMM